MMREQELAARRHTHTFNEGNPAAERGTRLVMWITASMMVIEIVAGWWYNSMALLADGWHMSSHAFAIGMSAFAYTAARKYSNDARFAFGTWKIEILGGFASAIFLIGVALMMVIGSIERIVSPQSIHYQEALVVVTLGLAVNLVCALILGKAHYHPHADDHHHHQHAEVSHHDDLNLKSAYLHVISDAATSVLAIIALVGGWLYGWAWLDPVMGIVGALLVAAWAKELLIETGSILLDREMDHPVVAEIREVIESMPNSGGTNITDLHVWRVGRGAYACEVSLLTKDASLTPTKVREQMSIHEEIVHVTVEINHHGYEADQESEAHGF